jgi:RNA polymerase sigma-70 factor (ECF subfamily)
MTQFAAPKPTSATSRFAALLESQKGTLYKVAYVYCRDPEDRRDLVQEMAFQLWRAFDRFDGRSSVATWTWRVATNVAISFHRREGRRIRDTLPIELGLEVADFDSDDRGSRVLRALIDDLDELSRALMLLYFEGYDHAEIAEILGTTPSNIGTRLARIRTRLKTQADLQGDGPDD